MFTVQPKVPGASAYEYWAVETPTGWYGRYRPVGTSFYNCSTTYEYPTQQEALSDAGRQCMTLVRTPIDDEE
jgi:hypothetical protein